jgi:hypothetical protein
VRQFRIEQTVDGQGNVDLRLSLPVAGDQLATMSGDESSTVAM